MESLKQFKGAQSLKSGNQISPVLIIGGGMAGIKLAHTLAEKGVDFVLLEHSEKLGGRIRSIEFHGRIFEAGANWI